MSKANTDILNLNGHEVFYSYDTPIAALKGDTVFLNSRKYSVTTSKQTNKYLATVSNRNIVRVEPQWFIDHGFDVKQNSRL